MLHHNRANHRRLVRHPLPTRIDVRSFEITSVVPAPTPHYQAHSLAGNRKKGERYEPCSGPGLNWRGSASSGEKRRSCGPNHNLSCGSVRGSSGGAPKRLYPPMEVRFRRSGCMISNTFCKRMGQIRPKQKIVWLVENAPNHKPA